MKFCYNFLVPPSMQTFYISGNSFRLCLRYIFLMQKNKILIAVSVNYLFCLIGLIVNTRCPEIVQKIVYSTMKNKTHAFQQQFNKQDTTNKYIYINKRLKVYIFKVFLIKIKFQKRHIFLNCNNTSKTFLFSTVGILYLHLKVTTFSCYQKKNEKFQNHKRGYFLIIYFGE